MIQAFDISYTNDVIVIWDYHSYGDISLFQGTRFEPGRTIGFNAMVPQTRMLQKVWRSIYIEANYSPEYESEPREMSLKWTLNSKFWSMVNLTISTGLLFPVRS